MKDIIGKVLMGENDTLSLLPIYRLQLLMYRNEISKALPGACVWVPLSECLTWLPVIDQYLSFSPNSASELGYFQSYFVAKTFLC